MYLLAATLLGAIAGSFLNALSFRLGTGRSILTGRSQCMHCGYTLKALDLVPVFSWIVLRGRCRRCGARISWQYPLVEAAAAGLSLWLAWLNPDPLFFAFWFVVWMVLLFVVVYDLRHYIIPWSFSLLLAALGLCHGLAALDPWVLGAGLILAAPLTLISAVSGGRWMGWGDGVLELGLGWLLGLSGGFTALLIAFWSGAAVGIGLMLVQRGYTMKSELPFAPFLIFGAGVAYFLHADILTILPALIP